MGTVKAVFSGLFVSGAIAQQVIWFVNLKLLVRGAIAHEIVH
jgi:hypothetical protein